MGCSLSSSSPAWRRRFVAEECGPWARLSLQKGLSVPRCRPAARAAPARALRSLGALLSSAARPPAAACPRALRRLFVAELCSWMAFMTFTLFYTDFVGEGCTRACPGLSQARRPADTMTVARPWLSWGLLWELPSMDVRVWRRPQPGHLGPDFLTWKTGQRRLPVQLVRRRAPGWLQPRQASGCL